MSPGFKRDYWPSNLFNIRFRRPGDVIKQSNIAHQQHAFILASFVCLKENLLPINKKTEDLRIAKAGGHNFKKSSWAFSLLSSDLKNLRTPPSSDEKTLWKLTSSWKPNASHFWTTCLVCGGISCSCISICNFDAFFDFYWWELYGNRKVLWPPYCTLLRPSYLYGIINEN